MHRKLVWVMVLFVSAVAGMLSCKKGDTGAPGNAVNVADSFKLANTDYVNGYWSISTGVGAAQGQGAKVATVKIDTLTDKIVNSGTVLVYLKSIDGLGTVPNQYTLLPFTIPSFSTGYLTKIAAAFEKGKMRIYYYYERTDASVTAPSIFNATVPNLSFRYVIIPGSNGFRTAAPPVDFNDYEAVLRYYHLQ